MGNSKVSLLLCIKGEKSKTQTNAEKSFEDKENAEKRDSNKEFEFGEDATTSCPNELEHNNNKKKSNGGLNRSCSFGPEQFKVTVFDDIFATIEQEAAKSSPTRKSVPSGLDSLDLYEKS